MHKLNQALDALEIACEGENELLAFNEPKLQELIEIVKTLPDDQREELRARLDRINTIIEGQMMLYSEEIEKLGGQIRNVTLTNAATQAYRTVAVFPVNTDKPANS